MPGAKSSRALSKTSSFCTLDALRDIVAKGGQWALVLQHYAHIISSGVCKFISLKNKKIVDVGGNKGGFCRDFSKNMVLR